MSGENLALLLTPPGPAAIAVVRVKGPSSAAFWESHFSRPLAAGRCVHGNLVDGETLIDDAVVVLIDPYTADLNLHGGPWVVHTAIELLRRSGFRIPQATPAPLPVEAGDGETELEREILSALPMARTELGVRVLLAQRRAWERYTAEPWTDPASIKRLREDKTVDYLLRPPTLAIVGMPNAGKSTLANQLFGQERSITADLPGTTRDWVGEIANIDGLPVMLVDTPGLRDTPDEIERTAIERGRERIATADRVLLVLDASRPPDPDQLLLLNEFPGAIRVINKVDRAVSWAPANVKGLTTVATTGRGVEAIRRAIVAAFCGEDRISVDPIRCWTDRQRELLGRNNADQG